MMGILEEILAYKRIELDQKKSIVSIDELKKSVNSNKRGFHKTLKTQADSKSIGLIAEIKKASPSKGLLKGHFNHIEIAKAYESGGASCLSVLTDEKYFQGNLQYIKDIKEHVELPILRKDFIIDAYQIYESIQSNADCILLIAAALEKDDLKALYDRASEHGLDSLIEVHNEKEMEIALDMNPSLIGINNRDLNTFTTNLNISTQLVSYYKRDLENKIVVSESGIFTQDDIKHLIQSNIYCFLVGESLIKENNIELATKNLLTIS